VEIEAAKGAFTRSMVDHALLHRLEQRDCVLAGAPIDFVGQQKTGKTLPFHQR